MNSIASFKQIVGHLICFYRKELNVNLDTFLKNTKSYYRNYCLTCNQCHNPEIICSPKTLYKIEKGEIPRNECIYYRLCENLGKNIDFNFARLNRALNLKSNIQESLIHYLSDFSKSNLCKLKLLIEQQLKILNNHIYFSEIYNLYIDIIDFAVASKKPNIKNLDIYVFLKDITETNDKKLILYYLYEISFKISNNLLDRKAIALQCSNYLDEPLFYKMKLHAKSNGNFLDAYVYLAGKELPTINNLNVNHKYCLYNQLAFIQLNSNAYESSYETTKLCLNLVETYPDSFSDIQLLETYKKLGIICYTLHKYEEVVQYLLKPIEAGSTIGANYALFFHSLEKLNTITTIKNILNMIDLNKIGNQNEKIVLVYYKMKYETNELTKNRMCDLEDYICLNLGPALKNIGEIHEQIFFDDLKFYISKTANYKKLFTFQK